jgi:hypothetical protein
MALIESLKTLGVKTEKSAAVFVARSPELDRVSKRLALASWFRVTQIVDS